ncbi:hypothetical protein BDW02DRAFT_570505 [Decorospora gaudefroyi]|uniref:Uncharacterized protein n=1 Tax=Decorospora gaudefroyi TaxID=184978 RepID=A0A6A5K5M9_9PLEO|nr:hypothetical protein BDW02DRAFT_570505 [Decorospora gaudefroyi]
MEVMPVPRSVRTSTYPVIHTVLLPCRNPHVKKANSAIDTCTISLPPQHAYETKSRCHIDTNNPLATQSYTHTHTHRTKPTNPKTVASDHDHHPQVSWMQT